MQNRYVLLNTPKGQYAIFDMKKGNVLEKGEGDGIIEMQRFQEDMRQLNQ